MRKNKIISLLLSANLVLLPYVSVYAQTDSIPDIDFNMSRNETSVEKNFIEINSEQNTALTENSVVVDNSNAVIIEVNNVQNDFDNIVETVFQEDFIEDEIEINDLENSEIKVFRLIISVTSIRRKNWLSEYSARAS